jgi:hypothetical protein
MALLATSTWRICFWGFSLVNIASALVLAPLAAQALRGAADDRTPGLPAREVFVLGSLVALSPAVALLFDLGQLSLVIGVSLLTALVLKTRGRPILAGIALAVAAIKPSTTLPFLLLFGRRTDRPTWITLGVTTLGLCLITGRPNAWPGQIRSLVAQIEKNTQIGGENDYTFANQNNAETMIGFDHTFYRLGMRDRNLIRVLEVVAVCIVGGWLFWNVTVTSSFSWGAACSLVSAYSMLFFYHRVYDAVILIVPVIYAAQSARSAPRPARLWFFVAGLACFVTLFVPGRLFKWGLPASLEWSGLRGWAFQALLLPWATWALLIAFCCHVIAEQKLRATQVGTAPARESGNSCAYGQPLAAP